MHGFPFALASAILGRKDQSAGELATALRSQAVICLKLEGLGLAGPIPAVTYGPRWPVLDAAVGVAERDGLWLEFGVAGGTSINRISGRVDVVVHGFDTFTGLPETWHRAAPTGLFSQAGKLPTVNPNVVLHPGLFHETLPPFLASTEQTVAFAHVDSDLYSSAVTVLGLLADRLRPGTVLVFDEYATPGPFKDEANAFRELLGRSAWAWEYLAVGIGPNWMRAAVRLRSRPPPGGRVPVPVPAPQSAPVPAPR